MTEPAREPWKLDVDRACSALEDAADRLLFAGEVSTPIWKLLDIAASALDDALLLASFVDVSMTEKEQETAEIMARWFGDA